MSYYHTRNPILVPEPYELSQGPQSPTESSPEELKAFYHDMERKDLERKLSKRNSNSVTSIWSRKSSKRTPSVPVAPVPPPDHRSSRTPPSDADYRNGVDNAAEEKIEEQRTPYHQRTSRSIIPEPTRDPPFLNTRDWSAGPLPPHKARYHIHNPHGPRWYRNYHLIPPSQIKPGMRPPSFFSTAFPPMGTSSTPEHMDDLGHAGPSRTPSHSPLPTPTSSDPRVAEGGRRSRKTSQTAPDNIDLLDVTDPWGTNWHHQSPYDWFGQTTTTSVDNHDMTNKRPRRASMTAAPSQHMSVTPSPLSQSTSAIHLHPPEPDDSRPRKLSKRRIPTLENVFSSQTKDLHRKTTSAPATPIERTLLPSTSDPSYGTLLPKRMSVAPAVTHSLSSQAHVGTTPRKEKRASVLGRLARKFSILRKPSEDNADRADGWHHISAEDVRISSNRQSFDTGRRQASPEKAQPEALKRIPPPSVDYSVAPNIEGPTELDRSSSISLEAPFSMGKLTIANPDAPDHDQGLPRTSHDEKPPLPPEKPVEWFHNGNGISYPESSHVPHSPEEDTPAPPQQDTPPDSQDPQSAQQSEKALPHASAQSIISNRSRNYQPSIYSHASHENSKTNSQPTQPRHESPLIPNPISFGEVESNRASRASTNDVPAAPIAVEQAPYMQSPSRLSGNAPARSIQHEHLSPSTQVPFPTTQPNEFLPPNRVQSYMSYSDSPYSASSVLANPPTPYDDRTMISLTPEQRPPVLPPKPRQEIKLPAREPSPGQSKGRQTETFKLVRSSSGNVYASGETIVAAGQQWEVIESDNKARDKPSSKTKEPSSRSKESSSKTKESYSRTKESSPKTQESSPRTKEPPPRTKEPSPKTKESSPKTKESSSKTKASSSKPKESSSKPQESSSRPKDSSSRAKDRERSSRREREHKRESTSRGEASMEGDYRTRPRSHESSKHQHQDSSSSPVTKTDSRRASRHSHNEHKSSQRRDGHRDRKPEPKMSEIPAPTDRNTYHAQPVSNGDILSARPMERNPSTTTRPTSELPSAAEMNAMRAKEAWEMERLWKARSMYGPDLNGAGGASHSIAAPNSTSSKSDDATTQGAVYGSNYTAFVVQTPFQGQGSRIYHSMPNGPPPIIYSSPDPGIYASPDPGIYSSPASIPSLQDSLYEPYERTLTQRPQAHPYTSPPHDHRAPSTISRPTLLSNPLPEPPRESLYAPASLSTSKSPGRSADYWTKYNV